MKRVLVGVLAVLGALTLLLILAGAGFALIGSALKARVPSEVVLELRLSGEFPETSLADPIGELLDKQATTVLDVVEALARARDDERVQGMIAYIDGPAVGLARAQEIRDAVIDFRSSGKWTIAFTETVGEFGPGNVGYYIATAFDEIRLQPSGDVNLIGAMAGSMFLKGMFDKLDIEPHMDHRYEYKNAMNTYTETAFTPEHREAMDALIGDWFDQIVAGVATGRDLPEDVVRAAIDGGPFLGAEAQEKGLVDAMSYWDEVDAWIEDKVGEDVDRLSVGSYLRRAGHYYRKGTTVALIQGIGPVTRGPSGSDLFGSTNLGSDTVASAFRKAMDDDRVEAILFRVDSPGGSYVASDTVWREVVRARDKGKPVVVSMGDVAGSGGYFVAMAADRIVAQPGTITGSIGVLGGKLDMSGFYQDWLGVTFDEVQRGDNSTFYYSQQKFTDSEWARFQAWLDRVYEDFTQKVAEGRQMPLEQVREIAKGRIWTGDRALDIGLIDAVGGYTTAIAQVRELLELDEDADIKLRQFPPKKPLLQRIMDGGSTRARLQIMVQSLNGDDTSAATRELMRQSLRGLRELRPVVQAVADERRRQILSMPTVPNIE